jgi:lysozyme
MPIVPNVADFSHWNPVNFTQIKAAGIIGVVLKATQGTNSRDPVYKSRYAAAKQMGFLVGAYDFATGDPIPQNVASFLDCANLAPEDAAVLDFENDDASQMTGDQAYQFIDMVNQKRGQACWIYGRSRFIDPNPATKRPWIDPQNPKWIDMAKYTPLWQSRYLGSQPADNNALFAATPPVAPWTANFGVQYTGDGVGPTPHQIPGLENGADLNVFLGTPAQIKAAWPGQIFSTTVPAPAPTTNAHVTNVVTQPSQPPDSAFSRLVKRWL